MIKAIGLLFTQLVCVNANQIFSIETNLLRETKKSGHKVVDVRNHDRNSILLYMKNRILCQDA